jgi:uncharacterized membrane protein
MTEGAYPLTPSGKLSPVPRRGAWVAWGLALQIVGVAIPVIAALDRIDHDSTAGSLTFRLVLHEMLHGGDVALVVLGVVVFAVGSIVLARPFVTHRVTLFVAVPVAAVAGVAVLGLIALVIAVIVAIGASNGGGGSGAADTVGGLMDFPIGRRRRR